MKQHIGYYSVMPATVRYDNRLKANEKMLYSEITALTNKTGECWATNAYFAELYEVDKGTVSRWVTHLEELGYIATRLEKDARGVIVARYINLAIPVPAITPIRIDEKSKVCTVNTKEENTTTTVCCESATLDSIGPVNWDNCSSDHQRLVSFYVRRFNPTLYQYGTNKQVAGHYRIYGKTYSNLLACAGSLDVACKAIEEFDKHYTSKGWNWNYKTLLTNFSEFVDLVMKKERGEAK